jgi:HD-like signal output (HDOD) protein
MRNRSRRQLQEIDTIEHAVMMLGVEPFFLHFSQFDIVEDQLKAVPQALLGLLNAIKRAQRAARFAVDWATWRCDLNSEELAVAALLYDLAELMTWCFAPQQALAIRKLQQDNPGVRSAVAQSAVFGFSLHELQVKLCQAWGLPEILLNLMDGAQQDKPRVKNVRLAVDLARHTADGWDDPALQDDFKAIAALMNIDEATLMLRLGLKKPEETSAPAPETKSP